MKLVILSLFLTGCAGQFKLTPVDKEPSQQLSCEVNVSQPIPGADPTSAQPRK